MSGAEDVEAIHAVVLDYVEGWFDGDGGRMQRALHPELVKRSRDARSGISTLSARQMIDATVEGEGRREDADDRRIEIELEHVSGDIASVTCLLPSLCRPPSPHPRARRVEDRQRSVVLALTPAVLRRGKISGP